MSATGAFLSATARRHRRLRALPLSSMRPCTMTSFLGGTACSLFSSVPMDSSSLYKSNSRQEVLVRHQYYNTNQTSCRAFATKKNNKKQNKYKQALKTNNNNKSQSASSIIGKRPGHTTFSPPENKVMSATKTGVAMHPLSDKPTQELHPKSSTKVSSTKAQGQTPLILPPSISQTTEQYKSDRDNKHYAHTQPFTSPIIQAEGSDKEENTLRNMFLQQGIVPPPPRPHINSDQIKTKSNVQDAVVPLVEIPEPDPSGVSHANPEDVLDMASMYDPSIHLPDKPNFNAPANRLKYEGGTPMTDELIAYIGVRGPITVAEFMRRVLRDGEHGYYTGKGARSGSKTIGSAVLAADDDDDDLFDDDNDWDIEDDDNDIHISDKTDKVGGEQIIGSGGDFITAPEVSQLFGEALLVWLMTQYQTLNSPSKIQIIEIGPGKGTLICDIVRSAVNTFPDFAAALTTTNAAGETKEKGSEQTNNFAGKKIAIGVHLVEVANGMRARQKESLENLEKEKDVLEKGYSFRFEDSNAFVEEEEEAATDEDGKEDSSSEKKDINSICVTWHDVLSSVPTHDSATGEPIPTFIICQELVDALPIHSFQKIEGGAWRERLVDCAIRDESEASESSKDIRVAASRYANAESDAKSALMQPSSSETSSSSSPSSTDATGGSGGKKIPRLRFVLPPDTTPALRTLLRVNNRGAPLEDNPTAKSLDSLPDGSIIEACPEGLLLAQDITDRIEKCNGGAALLIDYGGDGMSGGDTMRGFWKHTQVHPLSRPGEVDVTADVDFGALREAVNRRIGLDESLERKRRESGLATPNRPVESSTTAKKALKPEAFGPVSQGKFLAQMGVVQRVEKKIMDDATTDEMADELFTAMERLMSADQMGDRYKVLAIASKKEGLFPPPGF